jgi:hypothetical protein
MRTFADRVLEGRFVGDMHAGGDAQLGQQQVNQTGAFVKADLAKAQVISAENVAEYMYAISEKEYWRTRDFGCLAPPFSLMFFEFRCPTRVLSGNKIVDAHAVTPGRWGVVMREVRPEDYITDSIERVIAELEKDFNAEELTPAKQRADRFIRAFAAGKVKLDSLDQSPLRTAQIIDLYEKCVTTKSWQPVEELVRRELAGARWVLSALLVIDIASSPQFVPLFPNLTPQDQARAMWVPAISLNLALDPDGNPLRISDEGDFVGVVEGAYGYGYGGWPDIVAETAHRFAEQLSFLF